MSKAADEDHETAAAEEKPRTISDDEETAVAEVVKATVLLTGSSSPVGKSADVESRLEGDGQDENTPPRTTPSSGPLEQQVQPDNRQVNSTALNFVMEHRIFLNAALALLAEREKQAPELGMRDPIVLKSGSLKKAHMAMNGVWKIKFVEIRRGMFSYYENSITSSRKNKMNLRRRNSSDQPEEGSLRRKDIPLQANACDCRAVKLHQKAMNLTTHGSIFELTVNGVKRLWMAKTRADRHLWMQTIQDAIVGGSVTRGNTVVATEGTAGVVPGADLNMFGDMTIADTAAATQQLASSATSNTSATGTFAGGAGLGGTTDLGGGGGTATTTSATAGSKASPLKAQLRKYMKMQSLLRSAKIKNDYVYGLRGFMCDSSQQYIPLHVPVKWISDAGENEQQQATDNNHASTFREESVDTSVEQLWRDLQRDSVRINGKVYRGDAGHGPERIVGALTRTILGVGDTDSQSSSAAARWDLTESQALSHARDILLSGNRTRSGGDSYFCVNTLCKNDDLVVIVPNGAVETQPISISVQQDDSDLAFYARHLEKTGWMLTRNKSQKQWRNLFFVLSESGHLSFYENALPRPHKLQGQIVLTETASISITKCSKETTATRSSSSKSSTKTTSTGTSSSGRPKYILTISKEVVSAAGASIRRERLLMFDSQDKLLDWVYALECTLKLKTKSLTATPKPSRGPRVTYRARRASAGHDKSSAFASPEAQPQQPAVSKDTPTSVEATTPAATAPTTAMTSRMEILAAAEQATLEHVRKLQLDETAVKARLDLYAQKTTASTVVLVTIQATTEYKICTLDPQGDGTDDWALVQAQFLQKFRIYGGTSSRGTGRILRGEEIVRVTLLDCAEATATPALGNTITTTATAAMSMLTAAAGNASFRNLPFTMDSDDLVTAANSAPPTTAADQQQQQQPTSPANEPVVSPISPTRRGRGGASRLLFRNSSSNTGSGGEGGTLAKLAAAVSAGGAPLTAPAAEE